MWITLLSTLVGTALGPSWLATGAFTMSFTKPVKPGDRSSLWSRVGALVKIATEMPEYMGQTMGAITLLGDEQARLIQDLAVKLVGAVELSHLRFAAGNSAQFRGDERHIVFLSMVDSPTGSALSLRQTIVFKQRYNVAASRAKHQLWLVHSLDPDRDLQAGDLRRALIEHARDPGARRRTVQDAQRRAESPFERAVIERLVNAGYRVQPQLWVGHYRIDMVVTDGGSRWPSSVTATAGMGRTRYPRT